MSISQSVILIKSDQGYAARCPTLPGCWAQGTTEKEALEKIQDATQEYQAMIEDSQRTSRLVEQQYWFKKEARRLGLLR